MKTYDREQHQKHELMSRPLINYKSSVDILGLTPHFADFFVDLILTSM